MEDIVNLSGGDRGHAMKVNWSTGFLKGIKNLLLLCELLRRPLCGNLKVFVLLCEMFVSKTNGQSLLKVQQSFSIKAVAH